MTILNSDTITGLEYGTVKPASRERMLQQLQTVAKDQACTLKAITNVNPPNSSAPYHSAHDHGAIGAPIAIPYAQHSVSVKLQERAELENEGWQSFGFAPFYVPQGITQVAIIAVFFSPARANTAFKFQVFNQSGDLLPNQENYEIKEGSATASFIVDVLGGEVNSINMLGYRSLASSDKRLETVIVTPQITKSRQIQNTDYYDNSSNFPNAAQYSSDYFTSFDSAMFADGMPVSSYILSSLSLNDALLYEVLTGSNAQGRARGNNDWSQSRGARFRL